VSVATSAGRAKAGPQLSLPYDSGTGNSLFGFGWPLSLPGDPVAERFIGGSALPTSQSGAKSLDESKTGPGVDSGLPVEHQRRKLALCRSKGLLPSQHFESLLDLLGNPLPIGFNSSRSSCERTTKALAAAKARGVMPGLDRNARGGRKSPSVNVSEAGEV
jgi:Salmonella virulence plasmid 65kDa B protein